jgi:hypothetical protein
MLEAMLINVIKGLVMDRAQSLAGDHVEAMMDKHLSGDQKKAVDLVVEKMPDNNFSSIRDFLK